MEPTLPDPLLGKSLDEIIESKKKAPRRNKKEHGERTSKHGLSTNPLDRLDKPLSEIIKESRTLAKQTKSKSRPSLILQPSHREEFKAKKAISGKVIGKKFVDPGRAPVKNAPVYFDVDAPKVSTIKLTYGVDVLPPPKKLKIFGKKATSTSVPIESAE
jgi:hypothetical protein